MLIGRFLMIVPIMAMAGSLAQKETRSRQHRYLPVSGGTFIILLLGTVFIGWRAQFPARLTLGPVVEHFLMLQGKLFLFSCHPSPATCHTLYDFQSSIFV